MYSFIKSQCRHWLCCAVGAHCVVCVRLIGPIHDSLVKINHNHILKLESWLCAALNFRCFLKKKPLKETIFCKRDL